ncbi:MAG TPA: DUF899 domain-containing protein [Kofleriaceae bacterium]|jgi:predicted dithiol-disulfide oxidoreductase (DUF899 family)|nr:DUF899 domain-containing protein [Kofleriaceae bacterium]
MSTENHQIVSQAEWLEARKQLLAREKQFTHERDQLSAARRALPWVRVTERYEFERARGKATLADLFDGKRQLIVYHFMFAPDWQAGCKSCSFWADNFNGIVEHLAHRDVRLIAVSRAPLAKLTAYARRLGWTFEWASSHGSTFNHDLGVSFTPDELASGTISYNYETRKAGGPELPGISVFYRDGDAIYHTYSCYARGLDMMNTAYHYLDLVPRGRDEGEEPMSWLRRRDEYGA